MFFKQLILIFIWLLASSIAKANSFKNIEDFAYVVSRNNLKVAQRMLNSHPNLVQGKYRHDHNTPLHFVNSIEMAKLLIRNRANPNTQNRYGKTPIESVAFSKKLKPADKIRIIDFLIKNGADIHIRDNQGRTLLHLIITAKDLNITTKIRMTRFLLVAGADPNVKDNSGTTLFYDLVNVKYRSSDDKIQIMKFLLAYNADLNIKNSYNGKTLLHSDIQNFKVTKFLLENGVDPNTPNNLGTTPLHIVKNPEIAKLLLDYGAKPNTQDKNGKTSLHFMVNSKYLDSFNKIKIIQLLLETDADPKIKDQNGKIPSNLTTDVEIIKLLQRNPNKCSRVFESIKR